jgi:probable biosynthetic protein (TIGR04098 family)
VSTWRRYRLDLGMPHLAPSRLSEVELLKHLAAFQWSSIAALAGAAPSELANAQGERLSATMIAIELSLGRDRPLEDFDEGCSLFAANRVGVFGKRIVEGLFLFDRESIPEETLASISSPEDLGGSALPRVCMVNAFVPRAAGRGATVLSTPEAFGARPIPELERMPAGIHEQAEVERTGRIEPLDGSTPALPLEPRDAAPVVYRIVPESDLNAAGALYCARYVAIMNYGERVLLTERLRRPLSSPLASCLSTERRRIYYFANADPWDSLRISTSVAVVPTEGRAAPGRWRTVMRLVSRSDLHRVSDGVLIASSLARKAVNVPGIQKAELLEAERLLGDLRA